MLHTEQKLRGFERSIIDHRERVTAAKPMAKPAEVPHEDILVPLSANTRSPIRIYRPENSSAPYPTIIYVPGTAFVAREIAFTEVICTYIAKYSNCQVIVINHRLAPEDQFPKGLEDAYSVMRYIVNSPAFFKIDKTRIAIVGYSSGGNFIANMAILAKRENLPIALQILISPMVDLSRSLQKFRDFENKDTAITDAFVEWFLDLYLPNDVDKTNPWLSPFWQKPKRLQQLPPTDIIFAEYDRFRSDAEGYFQKLQGAGVDVRRLMVKGEDHSFLWYKLEIIETIGARLKMAFNLEPIPRPFASPQKPQFIFLKPNIPLIDGPQSKNGDEPTITAKL